MTDERRHGDDGRRHEDLPDPAWPVVESNAEYETPWFTGGYDLVEQPNGTRKRYYWAELATAVVIVAVTDAPASVDSGGRRTASDGPHVLFVEQYRPTIRETQFELPAGVVEAGESYTAAGARELREETGFDPSGTSLLQDFWVATGLLQHRRAFVFAEGLTPTDRDLDDSEFLEVRPVPVEEALSVARRQPTNDATVEGLLLARDEGLL